MHVASRYGRAHQHPVARRREIDLGLAVLCALIRPGESLTPDLIGEITGLSSAGVRHIERVAVRKLRRRVAAFRLDLLK